MIKTTSSQLPQVLKHDFPNESINYMDEKMEEGQYKKRFRYDRPLAQTTKKFNTGDIYTKLLIIKREPIEERFKIKPVKKLNTMNLHYALHKIRRQKDDLDAKIEIADRTKHNFKENDLCMLAYAGAIEFVARQHGQFDEEMISNATQITKFKEKPQSAKIPRVQSAIVRPKVQVEEDSDYFSLEVEGKGYNFSTLQRPQSSYSTTVRPLSNTTKNDFGGIRNLLVQQIEEEQINDDDMPIYEIAQQNTFLSPCPSDHYYPNSMRGAKVKGSFMKRGIARTQSAAQKLTVQPPSSAQIRPLVNSASQHSMRKSKRPQTAYTYYGKSAVQLTSRAQDHLDVIQEMKRQDDIVTTNQDVLTKVSKSREKLQVTGQTLGSGLNKFQSSQITSKNQAQLIEQIVNEDLSIEEAPRRRPISAVQGRTSIPKINIDGSNFSSVMMRPIHD